jgi:hypothetical protein
MTARTWFAACALAAEIWGAHSGADLPHAPEEAVVSNVWQSLPPGFLFLRSAAQADEFGEQQVASWRRWFLDRDEYVPAPLLSAPRAHRQSDSVREPS